MEFPPTPPSPSPSSPTIGNTNLAYEKYEGPQSLPTQILSSRPESPASEYSIELKPKLNGMAMRQTTRMAIQVENVMKSYGKQKVLNGLCMSVQEGTIYGLLGASGCGKTTILSCIVGLRQIDDGRISIFGKAPGTRDSGVPGRIVGYMPQEVALNEEFTMLEVCHYFGRLYGMDTEKVNDRVDYLVELLDLKKCKGRLSNFSGGQKRRASFVIALLHEAEILILDEPTVGVDPLLRAKIWSHIRDLADNFGTTVIITTHYIEEMRQAERVGIMREGQLMAEASPGNLLAFHNATMLEDVVLKYCLQTNDAMDETNMNPLQRRRNTISFEQDYNNSSRNSAASAEDQFYPNGKQVRLSAPPPYLAHKQKTTSPINRIRALVMKNVTVLMRNVGFILFLICVPALLVGFFGLAVGKPPQNIGLGFVNDENPGSDCKGNITLECRAMDFSCAYLDILRSFDIFKLAKYPTTEAARNAVEDKTIWGYVHFSNNFSTHIFDRTLGIKLTNHTIHGSKVRVRLDMSSISVGVIVKKLIFDAYRIFSQKLLTTCKVDITGRDLPVEFEEPIYGTEDSSLTTFVLPGIVIGVLPFLSCVSCAISYIIEKKDGMLDRTKVAGVTALDIMLSHAIPQFGIVVVQGVVAFSIMYLFDVPFDNGSPLLAYILTVIACITGMTMGFMAAEVFDEEKNAMLFAMATIFPSFLLSGLLWPSEGLPAVFKIVSYFLPGTLAGEALRSILLRGWNATHFTVYMGFLSQSGFIVSFIALTYIIHRLRK